MTPPAPYLPRRLVSLLSGEEGSVRLDAALLFVDITGYTSLTDQLATRRGAAGIDRVARVVGERFARMAAEVEAWHGEVVLFAGDGMLGWWPGRSGEEGVARAVGCAVALQAGLDAAGPLEGVTIGVKQVVLTGDVEAVRLGGPPHAWWPMLAGPAVRELGGLSDRAPRGRVLLSPGAASRWQGPTEGELVGAVSPGRPPEEPEALPPDFDPAAWMEPHLAARPRVGASAEVAELRALSVLFAHVAAEAGEAQPAVAAVQSVVAEHRGSVIQAQFDDKGLVLVAAFGLPALDVFRPEDPALAALGVHAAVRRAGLACGVGLTTGTAVYGDTRVGGARRLAVSGPAMNLAARLMLLGDGVHCDATSARAAREAVSFGEPRTLRLKGIASPVAVRTAVGSVGERAPAAFVGREDLIRRLTARLTLPGVVALRGEAGSGKTAILDAIEAASPVPIRRIDGRLSRALVPGAAVVQAVGASREGLERSLGEDAPLLAAAAGVAWPDTPATAGLRGSARADRTTALLGRLLDGPAVLVDDAQWLDSASLDAILARAQSGASVILAARIAEGRTAAPRLAALLADATEVLPLDAEAVAALARIRLGAERLPDGLVDWLLATGRGHPRFTLELLAVAQERGFLELDSRGGVLYFDRAGLRRSPAPATVHAAVVVRLDTLPAGSVELLKAASAVGTRVDREALVVAAGEVDRDALEPLLDGGWLREQDAGYVFPSESLREIVHDLLVRDQLRMLHGRLATWMERRPDESGQRAGHLAFAGEPALAIAALEGPFARAIHAGMGRDAGEIAHRALALDADSAELGTPVLDPVARARWRWRVALACREYGDTDDAVQHLEAAAADLGLELPAAAGDWRRTLVVQGALQLAEWALPTLLLRRDAERAGLRASVLNFLTLTSFVRTRPPEVWLSTAVWAVRLGRRAREPAATALASSLLAVALSRFPWMADRFLRAAEAQAVAVGDDRERLDATLGRLLVGLVHGRWDQAESAMTTALPLLAANRTHSLHATLLGVFACIDLVTGRLPRCAERCEEMLQLAERDGYLQARGWARNVQASLAMLDRDYVRVQACADEARSILDRRGEPDRLSARALHAEATRRLGDLSAAIAEVDELEALFAQEATMSLTGLEAYGLAAEIRLHALATDARQGPRADIALRRLRTFSHQVPIARPRLGTLTAFRARILGRVRPGDLEAARREAERWSMPLEVRKAGELLG